MQTAVKENDKAERQSESIIIFPWAMPGLDDFKEYILKPLSEDMPFYFLRSTHRDGVEFLLINPFSLFTDYEFDLSDEVVGQLKITDEEKVAVLCIVNTSRGIDDATANLMAPIVINTDNMLAKQVVLNNGKFSIRTPLPLKRQAEKEET